MPVRSHIKSIANSVKNSQANKRSASKVNSTDDHNIICFPSLKGTQSRNHDLYSTNEYGSPVNSHTYFHNIPRTHLYKSLDLRKA